MARPRWEKRTTLLWMFNGVALVMMIIFLLGVGMWVRSHFVDEEFAFAPRKVGSAAGISDKVQSRSWWGSSGGKIKIVRVDYTSDRMGISTSPGYQRNVKGVSLATFVGPGGGPKEERMWTVPGISFRAFPIQLQRINYPQFGAFTMWVVPGMRSVEISWWVVVMGSAVVPLVWARRAGVMWGRRRRERKGEGKICLRGGYDMRATPERCPECGSDGEAVLQIKKCAED